MHRITLELKERLLRCEKLQAKFEIISAKHRGSGEDDGEERTQVCVPVWVGLRAGADWGWFGGGIAGGDRCCCRVLKLLS